MTRFRLPLAAALLLAACAPGGARAEQAHISGPNGSPLTTTDGVRTVTGTTSQTYGPGFQVTGSAGAAVIGLGPLPTSCAGLQPGTLYDNGTSTPGICRSSSYIALHGGGHIALHSGGAILTR